MEHFQYRIILFLFLPSFLLGQEGVTSPFTGSYNPEINYLEFTALDFDLYGHIGRSEVEDNGSIEITTEQEYADWLANTFPNFPQQVEISGFPFTGGGSSGKQVTSQPSGDGNRTEEQTQSINEKIEDIIQNGLNQQNAQGLIDNGVNVIGDQLNPNPENQKITLFETNEDGNVVPSGGTSNNIDEQEWGDYLTTDHETGEIISVNEYREKYPGRNVPFSTGVNYQNGSEQVAVIQNGQVDQDNDVPTLLSIRAKMEALEKESRGIKIKLSNPVFNEQTKQMEYETETLDSETTYSDIHQELQKLNLATISANQDSGIFSDSNTTDQNTSLLSFTSTLVSEANETIDYLNSEFESVKEWMTESVSVTEPSDAYSTAYVSLPSVLTRIAKSLPSTINLFDMKNIGFDITLKEIASWVSLVIGLVAVYIYGTAMKEFVLDFMKQLTMTVESNSVTNYSFAGFSVGALAVKKIQIVAITTMFASIFISLNAIAIESVGIGAYAGTWVDVFDAIINSIGAGYAPWAGYALQWFHEFVPIISILAMVGTYFTSRFLLLLAVLVTNRFNRYVS